VVDRDVNSAKNLRDEALRICGVHGSGYLGTENAPVDSMSDCPVAAIPEEAGTTVNWMVPSGTVEWIEGSRVV
jgi:hypothetical protein